MLIKTQVNSVVRAKFSEAMNGAMTKVTDSPVVSADRLDRLRKLANPEQITTRSLYIFLASKTYLFQKRLG